MDTLSRSTGAYYCLPQLKADTSNLNVSRYCLLDSSCISETRHRRSEVCEQEGEERICIQAGEK